MISPVAATGQAGQWVEVRNAGSRRVDLSGWTLSGPSGRYTVEPGLQLSGGEYAVLGFLCAHAALRTWPDRAPLRTLALSAFLATAWGLSDELHQAFVPGRSAEVADLVADAIGALAGAGLRGVVRQFATRRAPRPQQETSS